MQYVVICHAYFTQVGATQDDWLERRVRIYKDHCIVAVEEIGFVILERLTP